MGLNTMQKIVIEGIVKLDSEDSGFCLVDYYFSQDFDNSFFVRLFSWDETKEHSTIRMMEGKKVRVTVEIIEE